MASGIAETGVEEKRGEAVLSCFVKGNGTLYAIVCKHARNAAKHGFLMKDKSGNESLLATALTRYSSIPETYNHHDIDIIEVQKEKVHICVSVFQNRYCQVQNRVRVFGGSVEDLLDKTVFMCVRSGAALGAFSIRSGEVLPSQKIPEILKSSYNMPTHFFVGNKDDSMFADAGDSGRVVAREADDGYLEIIGIVLHKYEDTTICLFLRSGLDFLNQQYDLQLSLYESHDHRSDDVGDMTVEPGETVTFIANVE